MARYTNTVAFFTCQEITADCVSNHPDDAQGQSVCLKESAAFCGTGEQQSVTSYQYTSTRANGGLVTQTGSLTLVLQAVASATPSSSTTGTSTSATSSSQTTSTSPRSASRSSSGVKAGALAAAIVVPVIFAILLGLGLGWFVLNRRRKQRQHLAANGRPDKSDISRFEKAELPTETAEKAELPSSPRLPPELPSTQGAAIELQSTSDRYELPGADVDLPEMQSMREPHELEPPIPQNGQNVQT